MRIRQTAMPIKNAEFTTWRVMSQALKCEVQTYGNVVVGGPPAIHSWLGKSFSDMMKFHRAEYRIVRKGPAQ